MPAIAFSNNDIALVAWTFDRHLDGCLGFAIHQIDASGKDTVLPALARFAAQSQSGPLTTEQAPIQKFWWKDLFAKRGGTYTYRIVPMGGTPGGTLTPLAGVAPLVSNAVTLTEKRPPFSAYFNRGIVATQALSHALNDKPSIDALAPHITDPADPIRIRLMGQLAEGVTSLLDRADRDGGTINAALYELNDPDGLEKRLQAADHGDPKSRSVILGNEQVDATPTTPANDDADSDNRAALKAAGVHGDRPHSRQGQHPAQQVHGAEPERRPGGDAFRLDQLDQHRAVHPDQQCADHRIRGGRAALSGLLERAQGRCRGRRRRPEEAAVADLARLHPQEQRRLDQQADRSGRRRHRRADVLAQHQS